MNFIKMSMHFAIDKSVDGKTQLRQPVEKPHQQWQLISIMEIITMIMYFGPSLDRDSQFWIDLCHEWTE